MVDKLAAPGAGLISASGWRDRVMAETFSTRCQNRWLATGRINSANTLSTALVQ